MDIKKLFGKKVKERRTFLRLTQEQLAEKTGMSPKSLSQIELGNNFVSAENLNAICEALQVFPKELFDFQEDQNSFSDYNFVTNRLKNNSKLLDKIAKIIEIID